MNEKKTNRNPLIPARTIKIIILILSAILAFFALILPDSFRQSALPVEIGDVATQDILAPYSLNFESEILTSRARQEAANAVDPIYLPADPSIGRRQVEKLRTVLYFITTIRIDEFATQEQQIQDIQAIDALDLPETSITNILQLSDSRWQAIVEEAANVLGLVMRNTIREGDLFTAKRTVPSLIDFSFPEEQASIITELVEPFIVPNSLLSEELTETAREDARESVEPIIRSFITGETLVRRGQIIRDVEWEALQRYGLIQTDNIFQDILGAGILTLLMAVLVGLFFRYQKGTEVYSIKAILIIAIIFLGFLSIARFTVIDRTILPYIYPLAAFGLTLSVIFSLDVAIFLSFVLGILTAYGIPNSFELTIFYIVPVIVGMLTLGKAKRISSFFGSGLTIGAAGIGIILGYRLPDSLTDWVGILSLSGVSVINGIGSASLTLLLQYVLSQSLGKTTALQLLDMSRPDHPLLQQMLRNAPGSYQHSLQVGNLAEQAAEAIGADGLLVRVGAIYHDCGKARNPLYFIENQVQDEGNPHDEIDPIASAQTIISHVEDGVNLARKYRLPEQVINFIREHHGTMYTHYQYSKAVKEAGNPDDVDITLFTYPGPRPQSRETALLMLADGTEARARAEVPKDEDALRKLIDTVFEIYEQNGQLDDTNLTLRDLQDVKDSFFHTLKGTYHPRVKYPAFKKIKKQSREAPVKASQESDDPNSTSNQ